ncbi:MAG: SDR family oxidoreductase [Coriobacteriia bacterium]|nr:SDR family oxidoreductase [Coriobacteriia bacterium]
MNVLITGGTSGIGLATARLYAARGASVAVVGRDRARLDAVAEELGAVPVQCDVADEAALGEALTAYVEACGVPDVVINAAGIVGVGEFVDLDPTLYRATIETDLMGTVAVCRFFAPLMIKRGSGHIANVASVAGYMGIYGYSAYSAAKFAVMGLSEALRFELKPHGVCVHVLCPPDTETPGFAEEVRQRPAATAKISGNLKPVSPEYIAQKLVRGIDRGKYYIVPGALSKFYFRLKGIWPEIYLWIVDGDVKKSV